MIKKVLTVAFLVSMTMSVHCQTNWETEPVNIVEINLDNITELDISFHEEKVSILPGTGDKLVVKEYRNKNDREFFADIVQGNGKLSIKRGGWISWRLFYIVRSRIEIYLPTGYKHAISIGTTSGDIVVADEYAVSKAQIKTTSGDIGVNKLQAETASISATSGDIDCKTLVANVEVHATSGDIRIENLTAGNASVKTTSGDIKMNQTSGNLTVKCTSGDIYGKTATGNLVVSTTSGDIVWDVINGEISANSTSGSIKLNLVNGGVTAQTTSGGIRCAFGKNIEDITLTTTSGYIALDLPKDIGCNFSATSSSGKISTPFAGGVSGKKVQQIIVGEGNPDKNIRLKTVSGDIRVKQ